jgi:hypothetical protein
MADTTKPLTVVSSTNNWGQIAIDKNTLTQTPPQGGYWFVVVDRSSLAVVYNQVQTANNKAPDLGKFNTSDYILIAVSLGVGLNVAPQGDLFKFLDVNGGGRHLRRVEQVGGQLNCGSLGKFGYALVGVLGNSNVPGFEGSQISTPNAGPILTLRLLPVTVAGKTMYTPIELSNT